MIRRNLTTVNLNPITIISHVLLADFPFGVFLFVSLLLAFKQRQNVKMYKSMFVDKNCKTLISLCNWGSFRISEQAVDCKLIWALKPWKGIKRENYDMNEKKHVQGRHCGYKTLVCCDLLKPNSTSIHRIISRTFNFLSHHDIFIISSSLSLSSCAIVSNIVSAYMVSYMVQIHVAVLCSAHYWLMCKRIMNFSSMRSI